MDTLSKPLQIVRLRHRQQRSIDTRERIIQAAAAEFAAHGFEGTSTRTVASKAGVQYPLVNYHFKNKDGLWRAVLTDFNERFADMYRSRLEGLRGVEAATKLRLVFEDFIRFIAGNPNFSWLMSHAASIGDQRVNRQRVNRQRMNWLVDEYVREFAKTVTELIRAAQKAGRFVEGDPHHLFYIFIGGATRLFMMAAEVKKVSGQNPMTPAYVDEHIRLCTRLFFRDPDNTER